MTVLQTIDGELLRSTPPSTTGRARIIASEGPRSVALETRRVTYEMIAEENPTCYAVLAKLVRQIATLPLRVYRGDRNGEREEVDATHGLRMLLETPAPRCSASDFKEWLVRPFYVHGNGLTGKYRGPTGEGLPTALLPAPWPYVSAWSQLGGPVEWWTTYQTGQARYFSVEDSIHLRWGSSNINGLGVSPLKALATTIRLDDSARTFQQSSFANGGRPGSMVVPPEQFQYKPGQREELREEIKRRFGGSAGAFDVALLAPGFDWKAIAHTAVEAEIIAARNINREEIAMVYDLSGPMINDLTHGTYSNVEQLHRMLYVTTLRPPIRRLEETLNAQLVQPEEEWADEELFIECDLSEVLRGNRREEIDAASEAYTNGLMTLNQCCEMLGLPRVKHELADIPNVPSNNLTPLTHVAEAHELAQKAGGDEEGIDPEQTNEPDGQLPGERKPNPGKLALPRRVAPLPESP